MAILRTELIQPVQSAAVKALAPIPGVRVLIEDGQEVCTLTVPGNCWAFALAQGLKVPYNLHYPSMGSKTFTPTRPLYSHQEEAVKFLLENSGGLLCDTMGLGKTSSAIVAAESHAQRHSMHGPRIVIAPKFLRDTWLREIKVLGAGTDEDFCVLEGRDINAPGIWRDGAKWYFVHYDVVLAWWKKLYSAKPWACIVDEGHLVKNPKSQRYQGCALALAGSSFRVILTGTPILNRVQELWPLLNLQSPGGVWGSQHEFLRRYTGAYFDGWGWRAGEPTQQYELLTRLARVYLRRTAEEAKLSLPPLTREKIVIELNDKEQAKAEKLLSGRSMRDVYEALHEHRLSTETLKWMTAFRKHVSNIKLKRTMEEITSALAQDESVVVFTWQKDTAYTIGEAYPEAFCVTGDVSDKDRQDAIDTFQATGGLMVATYGALSVGVTLTKARIVILHDLEFVPATLLQAEGRVNRIGQTRPVLSKWMMAENTLDEFLARKIMSKADTIKEVLNDDEALNLNDIFGDYAKPEFVDVSKFLTAWRAQQ